MNLPYRCAVCGATFEAWAPAERHADAEHHHRLEIILDERSQMGRPKGNQKMRRDQQWGEKRMGKPPPNTVTTQSQKQKGKPRS